MELTPWRSRQASPISSLQAEMNRMLEQFFNTPFAQPLAVPVERGNGHGALIVPVLDVKEDQETLVITAELPGVSRDDVQIRVHDNILELRGHKSEESKQDDDNIHVVERSYGSFARRIVLPAEVDSDRAEATMERGVLTLRLPKAEPKPGMKSIEIKEGSGQREMAQGGSAEGEMAPGGSAQGRSAEGEMSPGGSAPGGSQGRMEQGGMVQGGSQG